MDRRMIIYSHDKKLREIIITRQTKVIRIPVQKGLNEIKMEISDKPTIDKLYTGDTRPMLLGIHCLKIGLK
jgi:type IV secretory pathway VirB3-like protein